MTRIGETILAALAWTLLSTAAWGAASWPVISIVYVAGGADTGVAAVDWTTSIDMVQFFEEADGAAAADSGISGDDDFADVGSVVRNTSTFWSGAKSATTVASTDYFTCAEGSCPGIDPSGGASLTWGCAVNFNTLPTGSQQQMIKKNASNSGWAGTFIGTGTNDPLRCRISRPTNPGTMESIYTPGSARSTGVWYLSTCVFSDPDGATTSGNVTLIAYHNAAAASTNTDDGNYSATAGAAFIGASSGSEGIDAYVDECFFDQTAWSAAQVARQASVGIAGARARCVTADQTLYLPCNSNSDCQLGGGSAICDTGASAIDDTYCVEGAKSGCCMGYNSTYGSGNAMTACNAAAP